MKKLKNWFLRNRKRAGTLLMALLPVTIPAALDGNIAAIVVTVVLVVLVVLTWK